MPRNNLPLESRRPLVGSAAILFFLALCTVLLVSKQMRGHPDNIDLNNLPSEGFAYNDTNGTVPGDPENGISDLKRLYQIVQVYRRRHEGKYPEDIFAIAKDAPNAPDEYGFRTFKELIAFFSNPDSKCGDATKGMSSSVIPYGLALQRPDRTPIGGPKRPGERDMVAYCPLYVHENIRLFNHERSTVNPVGFYLVLWDDGAVEKIPHDAYLYVDRGGGNYSRAFIGQPGIPVKGTLSYMDFHKKFGLPLKGSNK